jgi:hypothetical protein
LRIPELVGFGTRLIANHDTFLCLEREFGAFGFGDVDICGTTERAESSDIRFNTRPGFFRSRVGEARDRRTVHEVDCADKCKDPETCREIAFEEHASATFDNDAIEDLC